MLTIAMFGDKILYKEKNLTLTVKHGGGVFQEISLTLSNITEYSAMEGFIMFVFFNTKNMFMQLICLSHKYN